MRLLVLLLALAHTAAAAPTAQSVLQKMQTFYAQQPQLTADFEQTVTNANFGARPPSKGKLWAMKPASFRASYFRRGTTTVEKEFIDDGTTLWIIDHPNLQIIQTSVQGNSVPAALSFLTGGGNLASTFNISLDANGNLELTPKQPSAAYAKVLFVVDPSGQVAESTVYVPNGDSEGFKFTNASTTKQVQASWFVFNPASLPKYRLVKQPQSSQPATQTPAPPVPAPTPKAPAHP